MNRPIHSPAGALLVVLTTLAGCGGSGGQSPPVHDRLVAEQRIAYSDGLHSENTEMARVGDRIVLVFRGGETGQKSSGNATIRVWESNDHGQTFTQIGEVMKPIDPDDPSDDRDIRDPKLVVRGDQLDLYAISRKTTGLGYRDLAGDAWTVRATSGDGGATWTRPVRIFEEHGFLGLEHFWGFWRITPREFVADGAARRTLYATAYDDGDTSVGLFRSDDDGATWQKHSIIVSSFLDLPSETELQFLGPNASVAVALVRMDNQGILFDGQTAICTSPEPFDVWECGRRIEQRFDGPTWVVRGEGATQRHFVFARKHLPCIRKRTAVYELRGDLTNPAAPLQVCEIEELESAGDTAYTALVPLDADRSLLSWYSSPVAHDWPWLEGQFSPSDIWLADVDFRAAPDSCTAPVPEQDCPAAPVPPGDAAAEFSGRYLLALGPMLWPEVPVLFEAQVQASSDGKSVDIALQSLEPTTLAPVGPPWSASAVRIDATGHFVADFGDEKLSGEAYPVLGSPIALPVRGVTLTGAVLTSGLACGGFDATVEVLPTEADRFPLTGSTFGTQRWPEGAAAPAPLSRCP